MRVGGAALTRDAATTHHIWHAGVPRRRGWRSNRRPANPGSISISSGGIRAQQQPGRLGSLFFATEQHPRAQTPSTAEFDARLDECMAVRCVCLRITPFHMLNIFKCSLPGVTSEPPLQNREFSKDNTVSHGWPRGSEHRLQISDLPPSVRCNARTFCRSHAPP